MCANECIDLSISINFKQKYIVNLTINFALSILKARLKFTILLSRFKFDSSKHIVPVFHVLGDHWITISNLRCDSNRIVVYD